MSQQEGRLVYEPGERYTLHRLPFLEGNPLDILVGNTWVSGHVYYEASDGNWYGDAGLMSNLLFDGREARFHLELVRYKQGDEDDLMLAAPGDLGELYVEDDWDEGVEDEQRYEQACSQEGDGNSIRFSYLTSSKVGHLNLSVFVPQREKTPVVPCSLQHVCGCYTKAGASPQSMSVLNQCRHRQQKCATWRHF